MSNISTWLPQWLIDVFPAIQAESADRWVTFVGVAIVAVCAFKLGNRRA